MSASPAEMQQTSKKSKQWPNIEKATTGDGTTMVKAHIKCSPKVATSTTPKQAIDIINAILGFDFKDEIMPVITMMSYMTSTQYVSCMCKPNTNIRTLHRSAT